MSSPLSVRDYVKFVVALVGAGVSVLAAGLVDNVVSPVEIVNVALAILAAAAAYQASNEAGSILGGYGKSVVVAATAAGQALVLVVADVASFTEVALSDWLTVLVTAGTALGVVILPNRDNVSLTG